MTNLFISSDLGTVSSGNIVSNQELQAFKDAQLGDDVVEIGYKDIKPNSNLNNPYSNNPFIQDYLTLDKVARLNITNIKICHFYAGPFTNTMTYLKAKYPNIKITNTIDAHNRLESIKEFENLGYQYPFQHVKDDTLYKMYSEFLKEADILIAPSRASKECLINDGAREDKIKILPHGTNIPDPKELKPIPEEFKIGYMGAYGADKGIKYLIESWSSLNYQDSELLLGGGNANKDLEPFIRRFSTGGRFNLLGYIQNIADFYNNVSVYIQPSVTEGFGMEVLEAMSYSRPVIVSDGCGAKDLVTNGKDGFVLPKRDITALADKIDWFKNNPDKLKEMGQKARERSLQYSWNTIRQQYINLWRSLL